MGEETMKSCYTVTGGAGFIGSHIVEELVRQGKTVRVVDNLMTGRRENLTGVMDCVEFIEGDLRDPNVAARAAKGADCILHQAAVPSVPRSIEDPQGITEHNVMGTLNVLIAARDAGVRRVVYASSSSVYGDSLTLPKVEDFVPEPLSPYAASKLTGEYYCRVFYRVYGLETVCLRYFNVFGPRQDPSSQYAAVIPKFIELALRREPLVVFGDGEQTRDFTYVSNVVDANLKAAQSNAGTGEVFNVGLGRRISLNDLVAELRELIDPGLAITYEESRPGDVKHSVAGIDKIRTLLDYTPGVSVTEGLRLTVEWLRARTG